MAINPQEVMGASSTSGLLAMEAAQQVLPNGGLTLEVVMGGSTALSFQLPMRISSVDDMYRYVNLRGAESNPQFVPSVPTAPWNQPDDESDGKNLIFVHGFRINEAASRNWARTFFKRFWLSGSRAKFHAVSWLGSEGIVADGGLNYHQNVCNAFSTASAFAQYVTGLQGAKHVVAHSLGCMVVASAIEDHAMSYDGFFMCNAAIPSEAFDSSLYATNAANPLVHDDWRSYPVRTWTSCWHLLPFGEGDDRKKLTWKGRFATVASSTKVYNFYSSGDEVFELSENGTPAAVSGMTSSMGRYSWHKQESFKGRIVSNDIMAPLSATDWCGWGFRSDVVVNSETDTTTYYRIHSSDDAGMIDDVGLMTSNTVFNPSPASMFATSIPRTTRDQILAKGIPALSMAAGRIDMADSLTYSGMSEDVNGAVIKKHGWGRLGMPYQNRWLHSDVHDMAFEFVQELFKRILEEVR